MQLFVDLCTILAREPCLSSLYHSHVSIHAVKASKQCLLASYSALCSLSFLDLWFCTFSLLLGSSRLLLPHLLLLFHCLSYLLLLHTYYTF